MPIPEPPPESALDGITPLPSSWLTVGTHYPTSGHDMRLFAIGYDSDGLPDAFRVRYIQPQTDYTQYQQFTATEWRCETYLPRVCESDTESFPLSYGVTPQAKGSASPPTETERRLLWTLYDEYLKSHTRYLPPGVDRHPSIQDQS